MRTWYNQTTEISTAQLIQLLVVVATVDFPGKHLARTNAWSVLKKSEQYRPCIVFVIYWLAVVDPCGGVRECVSHWLSWWVADGRKWPVIM
jgi:hypothetical protein